MLQNILIDNDKKFDVCLCTVGYAVPRFNMNFDNLITENLVLNIVKDKFRHDESVISVSGRARIFNFILFSDKLIINLVRFVL